MTLACRDANSKLVVFVSVAGVDDEDREFVADLKLRFGHKAKLLIRL